MIHVTIQQLSSYLDEQLAQGSADLVRQHIEACPECGTRLGAFSRMDEAITRALTHDPGDGVLERIERGVSAALGPDAKDKAQEILASAPAQKVSVRGIMAKAGTAPVSAARRSGGSTIRNSTGGHATGGNATAASAGAPAAPSQRSAAPVAKRRREVPATAWTPHNARGGAATAPPPPRRQGSASGMWIAVFSLAVIAGSAGVMVSHSGTVQGWLDSLVSNPNFGASRPSASAPNPGLVPPASDASDSSAMTVATAYGLDSTLTGVTGVASSVPPPPPPRSTQVRDGEFQDESGTEAFTEEETAPQTMRADEVMAGQDGGRASSGRASSAAAGGSRPSDPYANMRPETQAAVRDAERVHQQTLFHPTAEQFDTAAARWERVLDGMSGPEQVTVRGRLADARYRAWEASPTPQRADAAITAIRSYLLFAPPGVAREESKDRLERLSPR